jgi:MFS superfamily sulfate permease-like transporter
MRSIQPRSAIVKDLGASLVVFLVALPLCMGIAIASGVPPALGLITGIMGGVVVGSISGSPFQVSGPAAGLAVIVAELVRSYGIEMLGPVLLLAGLFQLLAGYFKLGQMFRAMSPAVIYGMLSGIGILILISQIHVMLDDQPRAHGLENLMAIPGALSSALTSPGNHQVAAGVGIFTIVTLLLWDRFKPKSLKLLPGALIGVVLSTGMANLLQLPIQYVEVPANLFESIHLPTVSNVLQLVQAPLLLDALTIAFIASAESLLSAVAVDRLHNGARTNFDRELAAQGIGNIACGLVGALPMTGVIVRSSVNVEAGAKSRFAAILHGVWLLLLVAAAPFLLGLVPTASLAGILVVTGYKLIEVEHIRKLRQYGRFTLAIFAATLIGIVATDLLTGVLIGIILTAMSVIYRVSRLTVRLEPESHSQRVDLYLEGAATFIRLPQLAAVLDRIPAGTELHVHLDRLAYIDHTCLDLFSTWAEQQQQQGSRLVLEWNRLVECYRQPLSVATAETASN